MPARVISRVSLLAFIVVGAIGLIAALAPPAQAVTYASSTCDWPAAGVVGGTNLNFTGGGTATCEVRWGTPFPATGEQSGLQFHFHDPASGVESGTPFDLGDLTHFNQPILFGTNATQADLALTLTFTNGGTEITPPLPFTFAINETLNTPGNCPGQPVPCDDIITFGALPAGGGFTLGGQAYTLQLVGFGPDPNNLQTSFVSHEGADNTAHLWARLIKIQPPTKVPEPGTWLLFATGLVSLTAYRRRRSVAEV
jgi:hypothetical protein